MADKFQIPKFASEADEAQRWYDHRDELTEAFEDAAAEAQLRVSSAGKWAHAQADAVNPAVTVVLEQDDVARAHQLAAKRGLRYQTYLKVLLHEALANEEKKIAS